jgi:hypothetical protein
MRSIVETWLHWSSWNSLRHLTRSTTIFYSSGCPSALELTTQCYAGFDLTSPTGNSFFVLPTSRHYQRLFPASRRGRHSDHSSLYMVDVVLIVKGGLSAHLYADDTHVARVISINSFLTVPLLLPSGRDRNDFCSMPTRPTSNALLRVAGCTNYQLPVWSSTERPCRRPPTSPRSVRDIGMLPVADVAMSLHVNLTVPTCFGTSRQLYA